MANKRTPNPSKFRQNQGKNTGKGYIPRIKVHEISSSGTSWRVLGRKTGRVHHLLSTLEKRVFLFLDGQPHVTDIREQFALNEKVTRLLADKHHIKHQEHDVMTTDFLVDFKVGQVAISVKPQKRLNHRTIQKFQLEKLYWNELNIEWLLVTDEEIKALDIQ